MLSESLYFFLSGKVSEEIQAFANMAALVHLLSGNTYVLMTSCMSQSPLEIANQ
jgi:hypothetical protein